MSMRQTDADIIARDGGVKQRFSAQCLECLQSTGLQVRPSMQEQQAGCKSPATHTRVQAIDNAK